jgi:hypothetical protein
MVRDEKGCELSYEGFCTLKEYNVGLVNLHWQASDFSGVNKRESLRG